MEQSKKVGLKFKRSKIAPSFKIKLRGKTASLLTVVRARTNQISSTARLIRFICTRTSQASNKRSRGTTRPRSSTFKISNSLVWLTSLLQRVRASLQSVLSHPRFLESMSLVAVVSKTSPSQSLCKLETQPRSPPT